MKVSNFEDNRGNLLAIEFQELSFAPVRCFVVNSKDAAVQRGGHKTGCRQMIILLTGSATFWVVDKSGAKAEIELREVGSTLELSRDDFIDYELSEPGSSILVLADSSYLNTVRERDK